MLKSDDEIYDYLNRHIPVSRATCDKLIIYRDLLIKWQSKINLIGSDTIGDIWHRHFLDSLQLKNFITDMNVSMVDLGSGAGFPGIVLSIVGAKYMTLIESDGKKCEFLREISRKIGVNPSIFHGRIEDFKDKNTHVFISRACASLAVLFQYIEKNVSHGTICLFPKGKNYSMEIEDAKKEWVFECKIHPSITDFESAILELMHIKRR